MIILRQIKKNVGVLFERACVGFEHDDKKADSRHRWITRYIRAFSWFEFAGERLLATVTLKKESV